MLTSGLSSSGSRDRGCLVSRWTRTYQHKGYEGRVEFDAEAKIFHGEVVGTRDIITFIGKSSEEVEAAFRDSIDDYLEF